MKNDKIKVHHKETSQHPDLNDLQENKRKDSLRKKNEVFAKYTTRMSDRIRQYAVAAVAIIWIIYKQDINVVRDNPLALSFIFGCFVFDFAQHICNAKKEHLKYSFMEKLCDPDNSDVKPDEMAKSFPYRYIVDVEKSDLLIGELYTKQLWSDISIYCLRIKLILLLLCYATIIHQFVIS